MSIEYLGNNKVRFRVSVGSTSRGTRRQRSKTVTYNKKRDVPQMYQDFLAECNAIERPINTVKSLLERYNDALIVKGVRLTTRKGYESCQKKVNSVLGHISAQELTTYQVDGFISQMAKSGLSPKYIKNIISYLSSAYLYGMKSGMVTQNPCALATKPTKRDVDIHIIEEDDLNRFLRSIQDERLDCKVCCELALFTGLRRGEIMGLTESDIHDGCIDVNKTRYRIEGKDEIQPTKTKKSTRMIAMPSFLEQDIEALIKEHHANDYNNTDFLIQHFGEPMNPHYIVKWLEKKCAENNYQVTMHGLRHTFTSMLNASGQFDIAEISSVLGHSNINTTLGIYTHVFAGTSKASRQVASYMEEIQKGVKEVSGDK